MIKFFKKILIAKMLLAFESNKSFMMRSISDHSVDKNNNLIILDVGCGNGEKTREFLQGIHNCEIYGIDMLSRCKDKTIEYRKVNLEDDTFPFEDNKFDIVYSNQVLEHILNKDNFIFECHRVLKKGGLFLVSTENIASLDNIISLLLGQEPICQHTGSKYNTSSFLSPHYMEKISGNKYLHKNVCSYYGLQRLVQINGFKKIKIKSFGNICKIFEKLMPIYNRLIVIHGIKE